MRYHYVLHIGKTGRIYGASTGTYQFEGEGPRKRLKRAKIRGKIDFVYVHRFQNRIKAWLDGSLLQQAFARVDRRSGKGYCMITRIDGDSNTGEAYYGINLRKDR